MKNKRIRLLSWFLTLVVVIGSIPLSANSIDLNSDEEITGATINNAECRILDYVDNNEFLEANHQQRLPDKEELNTYVFKNFDGTETAYFMRDNVKYYDEHGVVKEKNLTLEKNENGYAPKSNDISVNFPNDIANGISVVFGSIDVSISPLDETFGGPKLSTDGKAVLYSATNNNSLFLMYTPTLTGFKEDIVLSKYYGVSSFRFMVKTNGLGIYTEESGKVFVAPSETSVAKAYFGDIIVNDNAGNIFFGDMSVTTVTDKQEYIVTVSVDEDILLNESIEYPIKIDPSISINSSNNPKTIHDTNMYSAPFAGTVDYLILGEAGTNVTSYSLMSFPGVYDSYLYSGISKDNILSANLYLYCTLYRVATVPPSMSAIPCTGYFWNDDQSITSTANQDGDMNYKCTSGMGTVNSYNSMNITQIIKYWKDSYDAARKGLLLYLPDSEDYALYPSSNNADSSKRPYLTIQYSTINHSVHYEFDDNVPVVLKNKSSSKVMRFYSNSLYQYNEDINDTTQQFKLKRYTDGRYVIANYNNYILTVDSTYNMTFSAPPAAGPGVYDNQLWYIVKTEDGYYQIVLYNNQNYCLAATSSSNGQLVLATNRSSDLSKWSIDFRNNVLRVFVNSNNIGTPNATVQLFKAGDNDSVILTTTNAGGYAFFGNLSATATQYGITASKEGYTRNSYTINNSETPLTFSGGGNGSGSFDVSISISSFANFPLLTYPLSETCKPPSIDLNQQYGWRNRDSGLDFHKGIDISRKSDGTRLGDLSVNNRPDVVSIANGKVVKVHRENTGSAGRYVVVVCDLDSDGKYDIQVRYLHLATIPESITKNAIVCPEQVIGKPGGSGNGRDSGYGVHLHIDISVYVNDSGSSPAVDNTIDPNAFFRQQVINEE